MKKAILKTLAFFDIFDRPVNFDELHLYLYKKKASEKILEKNLAEIVHQGTIAKLGEWYFLPGRLKFLEEHPERQKISQKLFAKAKKYTWKLKKIPFVKMAAVVNSVAFKTAHSGSDIDLFIVCDKNRLYTARTFLLLYYRSLGIYQKRGKERAGKIGVGFFVDNKALDIDNIRIKDKPASPIGGDDIYFDFWTAILYPLYGEKSYKEFIKTNSWILKKFPNFSFQLKFKIDGWHFADFEKKSGFAKFFEWLLGGVLGNIVEGLLRRYHIKHTWSLPENHLSSSTTIAKEHILKLHAKDRRAEFAEKFEEKMKEIGY